MRVLPPLIVAGTLLSGCTDDPRVQEDHRTSLESIASAVRDQIPSADRAFVITSNDCWARPEEVVAVDCRRIQRSNSYRRPSRSRWGSASRLFQSSISQGAGRSISDRRQGVDKGVHESVRSGGSPLSPYGPDPALCEGRESSSRPTDGARVHPQTVGQCVPRHAMDGRQGLDSFTEKVAHLRGDEPQKCNRGRPVPERRLAPVPSPRSSRRFRT